MTKQKLALEIGLHVLKVFDEYQKKPIGKKVVTAVMLPRERYAKEFKFIYPRFDEWIFSIEMPAAPMVRMTSGLGEYKYLSPSEFFKMVGELGWDKTGPESVEKDKK